MVSVTPGGKEPRYPLDRRLGGPQNRSVSVYKAIIWKSDCSPECAVCWFHVTADPILLCPERFYFAAGLKY
jgi:hypothetical protein